METITYESMTIPIFKRILHDAQTQRLDYLKIVVTKSIRNPDKYFDLIKNRNVALSIPNATPELEKHGADVEQREQREIKMKTIMAKPTRVASDNGPRRAYALSDGAVRKDSGNFRISHLMHLVERRAEDWVRHFDWDEAPDGLFGFIPKFQRGLVWTLEQKQALIMSMLNDVPIGVFYINELASEFYSDSKRLYELDTVLYDGQQRFMAIKDFLDGTFPLTINGEDIYVDNLHDRDVAKIKGTLVPIYTTYITDVNELIDYYVFINTGGTLHTKEDIEKARRYQSNHTTH